MQKKIVIGFTLILATILLSLLIFFTVILSGHFIVSDEKLVLSTTTTLVDREGNPITKLFIENRETVPITAIPTHVQEAFVAIEDSRFREHVGIDIRSIGRALYRDILAGGKVEGGSTLTQQLAKRVYLTSDKTWLRKVKEILIAINIERRYSKDEILGMYLNQIYFGHGAYGIQAASKLYFNKDVSELTVEEGALLAGLPKAPNSYSPLVNIERSKERRDLILTVMEQQGLISAEEMVRAKGKTIALDPQQALTENEAYYTYIDMVLDEAKERYQLSSEEVLTGGYRIVVPMSRHIQETALMKMRENRFYPEGNEDAEATFVMLDAKTGGVLAAQGGREYVRLGLNRVHVKRQPGSVFKPLAVYAPALESGIYEPYSLLKDEALDYDGYTPRNSNHEYAGTVTMYEAITRSVNAPAVWLLNEIGLNPSLEMLNRFGFDLPDRGLAIALGGLSEGVTPLDLATAYRAFAAEGKKIEPYFIEKIYNNKGELIGEAGGEESEEVVLSPQTAWYMTRMLESVVTDGTGKNGRVNASLAGKTGTTSFTGVEGATMDAWFVGYTPNIVGAAWMGYDVTNSEHYLRGGSSYPTVLFKEIVNELPKKMRDVAFQKPTEVDELDPPVALPVISDLKAKLTFGGSGMMSVELTWTTPDDDRIQYDIYERHQGERKKIATVTGENIYHVSRLNPFSKKSYEIVPVDSTTDEQGQFSNIAEVEFQLFR